MIQFECCYKCVPPKRKPGCHATCPEYKKIKAVTDEIKQVRSLANDTKSYIKNKTYVLERRKHLR